MPKISATDHFTAAEVKRRLSEAKRYLQRYKTQRLLFLAPADHLSLPCISLQDYDCLNEYNFVNTVDLSEELIRQCVKDNREMLVDESKFKIYNLHEYVDEYLDALRRLFCVTSFCLLDRKKNMMMKVVICLGSLHHAPRLFYRDTKNRFYYDKLAAYNDLF
jgi:hypothetical protein